MGPLLFTVFVNDVPEQENCCNILYADDTTLITNNKCPENLEINANIALNHVAQYFDSSLLEVNPQKTSFMLFSKMCKNMCFNLAIGDELLTEVQSQRFLGVFCDSSLNWNEQYDYVCKRLSSVLYLLRQYKTFAPQSILMLIYFGLFQTHLTYCITVWGSSSLQNHDRILRLQKSALRIITGGKRLTSCRALFKQLGVLTFPSIFIFYCILQTIKTPLLTEMPVKTHNYELRLQNDKQFDMQLPHSRLKFVEKKPSVKGALFFNSLPIHLKQLKGKKFRTELYNFLIESTFYSVDEFRGKHSS